MQVHRHFYRYALDLIVLKKAGRSLQNQKELFTCQTENRLKYFHIHSRGKEKATLLKK